MEQTLEKIKNLSMNSKTQLLLILLITTFLSKEVLVFNEEILVLFAFGVFIYLTYSFASQMISAELDSRSTKIQDEFSTYKNIQEKTLIHLISYHNKQKLLSEEIKSILQLTKKDIDLIIQNYTQTFVKQVNSNIDEKLKKVLINESKANLALQQKINDELYAFLINSYTVAKTKKSSSLLLTNSINTLLKIK